MAPCSLRPALPRSRIQPQVSPAAATAAAAERTQVSLVAYIIPIAAPARIAHARRRVRTYRQPQPSAASVKNTSSISWM